MDRDHRIDAPNDEELRTIEQIQDRSDLTGIYRKGAQQFEGDILSKEAREQAKAQELEALTSGLGKSALSIGFFIIYPFIGGALLALGLFVLVRYVPDMVLLLLAIAALVFWLISSFKAYEFIFKTFYTHALRAGPFVTVMVVSLIMASQAIYGLVVDNFSGQSIVFNISLISLLLLLYSLITSFILLGIWGNSKLKSGSKVLVSGLIVILSAFFVISTYLF
jgi:cation transport ATPase